MAGCGVRLLSAYARRDAGPSVSLVLASIYIDDPGGSFFLCAASFLTWVKGNNREGYVLQGG